MSDEEKGLPARFAAFCAAVVRPLPFHVPPNLVGYAIINGFTFGVDMSLLTLMHSGLGWPLPVSLSISYVTAFGLSFVLNRVLNFRSHAPVAGQTLKYAIAVALNFLIFILGVGDGLVRLGVEYHLSRIAAGTGEAIYMYCVMRWVVFTDTQQGTRSRAATRGHPR